MGLLPAVVGIENASGERVDQPRADGSRAPIVLRVGEGIDTTSTVDGGRTRVELALNAAWIADAAEGAGAAVATIAALRAVPESARQNGQSRAVLADADGRPFAAIFKTTGGTGLADDGVDVLIPDDKAIGDPERWYRDTPLATASLPGRITAADKTKLAGLPAVYQPTVVDSAIGGTDELATIQAAIDAATAAYVADGVVRTVLLSAGRHYVSGSIDLKAGVRLCGMGARSTGLCRHASWSPDVGQADVSTNAVIRIRGAVSTGLLDTTLAASPTKGVVKDARQCTVNAAGAIVAGSWIVLSGHNDAANDHVLIAGGGSAETQTEMVQVASTYVSGTTFPFADPASQHHTITNGGVGTAQSVKGCLPVGHASVEGIKLAFDGSTVAVGILCQYAADVALLDVSGAGFSRALVNAELGVRRLRVDVTSLGENNCVLLLDSAVQVVADVDCVPGLRSHANGTTRWAIELLNRCTDIEVRGNVRRQSGGVHIRGGVNLRLDLAIDDLDDAALVADQPAGGVTGVAFQGSVRVGTATYDALALSVHLNLRCTNVRQSTDTDQCAVDLYRIHGLSSDHVEVNNEGLAPGTTLGGYTYRANGVRQTYCKGGIDRIRTRGVHWAYRATGNHNDCRIQDAWFYAGADDGAGNVAVDVSYGGADAGPVFGVLRTDNMAVQLLFDGVPADAAWVATPDLKLLIDRAEFDHVITTDVLPAYNSTDGAVVAGDVIQLDTGAVGERLTKQAAGPGPACAVVVIGGANSTWILVSMLPARRAQVTASTAAVQVGDLLEVDGSKRAVANNSSRYPFGVALTAKAAGAEGPIIVGPLSPGAAGVDTATADTLAARGSSAEMVAAWFAPEGTVSASGLLRNPNNTTIASALKADGTTTAAVLLTTSGNLLQLGSADWTTLYLRSSQAQIETNNALYFTSGSNTITHGNSDTDFGAPLKVDTINEHTAAAGVTVDGLVIKDSRLDAAKWREHSYTLEFDDVAAGTPLPELLLGSPHQACTVVAARATLRDAITGDDTNFATLLCYRRNGSGTQATIASLATTSGVNFTAWVSRTLGTLSNTALAADESLTFEITKAVAGQRCRGTITVTVTYD